MQQHALGMSNTCPGSTGGEFPSRDHLSPRMPRIPPWDLLCRTAPLHHPCLLTGSQPSLAASGEAEPPPSARRAWKESFERLTRDEHRATLLPGGARRHHLRRRDRPVTHITGHDSGTMAAHTQRYPPEAPGTGLPALKRREQRQWLWALHEMYSHAALDLEMSSNADGKKPEQVACVDTPGVSLPVSLSQWKGKLAPAWPARVSFIPQLLPGPPGISPLLCTGASGKTQEACQEMSMGRQKLARDHRPVSCGEHPPGCE